MKDTKKSSRIRRSRGYAFEQHVVKILTNAGWNARRLGSPSTELPDVFGVNDEFNGVIAVEAKSTAGKYAYVPYDQIRRCRDWVEMFGKYKTRRVILAFKFKGNEKRKLRYHYKVFSYERFDPMNLRCDYDGKITTMKGLNVLLDEATF